MFKFKCIRIRHSLFIVSLLTCMVPALGCAVGIEPDDDSAARRMRKTGSIGSPDENVDPVDPNALRLGGGSEGNVDRGDLPPRPPVHPVVQEALTADMLVDHPAHDDEPHTSIGAGVTKTSRSGASLDMLSTTPSAEHDNDPHTSIASGDRETARIGDVPDLLATDPKSRHDEEESTSVTTGTTETMQSEAPEAL